jgi:hypothetical protein
MKIIPPELFESGTIRNTNKTNAASGDEFKKILQQSLNQAPGETAASATLPPFQTLSPTRFDIAVEMDKAMNIERVEGFLNVLDQYQQQLANPMVGLKEISPVVDRMEKEIGGILPLLESLPEGDKMKDIINRAVITSSVEIMKFRRGDYL